MIDHQEGGAPVNIEVEQALLGALIINNRAFSEVSNFLRAEHFAEPLHGRLFEIIATLIDSGKKADIKLIRTFLPSDIQIGALTPVQYLARLAADAVGANAESYGRHVHDLAVRRQLITFSHVLEAAARDAGPSMTTRNLLDEAETRLSEIRQGNAIAGAAESFAVTLSKSVDLLAIAYKQGEPAGFAWPLDEMEYVLDSRIEPGNLYGLLGASGDGKTSLTLQTVRGLAEAGVPTLFLSGEQTPQQCIWQMHAQRLGIEARFQRHGKISEDEFVDIVADARALRELPMEIQQWSGLRIAQIGTRVRAFARRFGGQAGVVVLDHIKKVVPDQANAILAQQVFQVYEGLKDIATSTGYAIIVLMQRNSEFMNRPVARPVRRDAYGGEGAIQNLDACLAVFRPEVWIKEKLNLAVPNSDEFHKLLAQGEQMEGVGELFGLKTRFGDQGRKQTVQFEARYTRFTSIPRPTLTAEQQRDLLDGYG